MHTAEPKLKQNIYLIGSKNTETVDYLFSCISISALPCHKVQEGIEVNVPSAVWIDNSQNSLEVDVTLTVLANRVTERHKT